MTRKEEFVPNEQLRHARSMKGWSQAELAEQVGTSFEIVSRWERGITVPSPYYRERLSAVLGKGAEELGFIYRIGDVVNQLPSPLVYLASSHKDAEKPVVSHLKTTLQDRGITLWSNRQINRQGNGHARIALREVMQAAQVILVILSPEAVSSRHVREALDTASKYDRPMCGIWIEGEELEQCLPEGHIDFAALIDAREKDTPALLEETAKALEQVRLASQNGNEKAHSSIPDTPTETISPVNQAIEFVTSQSRIVEVSSTPPRPLEPTKAARPVSAVSPLPTTPPITYNRKGTSRKRVGLHIGLAILVIVGGLVGSLGLLTHFGVIGARSSATAPIVARGGTWTDDLFADPDSLIPINGGGYTPSGVIDQALYLPLFYSDDQGSIYPGAATEVPSLQNGGISADATTWTFHLKPNLVWSDGAPYDMRDVGFTWQLWRNPKFGIPSPPGLNLISSADISADALSITFHLKQPYAPFLSLWVDGAQAPLPAHHFSQMAPQAILKSHENLNPQVVNGPFMVAESLPGGHYTLVRNPRYYRAGEGLPYLDKVIFRIGVVGANEDSILKDLQAGSVDSAWFLDPEKVQQYKHLTHYMLVSTPTSASFEAIYFNFHNTILANHPEVRLAMAMAIDHQALIEVARHGSAQELCTDQGTALHPGFDTNVYCQRFDPVAANKLLEDNSWVKAPDGVRAKGGQRLEFEYSTTTIGGWRDATEAIVQRNFMAIGIKLDIQNYPRDTFFGPFLNGGKLSPPTGAVASRYDIGEWNNNFIYDPDDSSLLACNQVPPNGQNFSFYCNHALDALYRQELATVDPGVRQQIFDQIHQIYLTDFPFIVLYSTLDLAIVRKGTHNYKISPFEGGTVNIWEWWCDNGKC